MRITVLAIACLVLSSCGKQLTVQNGFDAIDQGNYAEAAAAFGKVAAQQTGCDRAEALAAQSAAIAAESLEAVLSDIPEAKDATRAKFGTTFENSIASINKLGKCSIHSLS